MVPNLLRGFVLLIFLIGFVWLYRAVVRWEGPLTEGPYQHRVVCKAVCK
jgi:hypothetical protein